VLSQRRAAAVKQFLVTVHGIDEQRLRDAGVGKQDPIEGLSPFAPQNRRVQFRGS
jgi:outer membrane protein OmpA-like peptidoglycan-associated protein